MVNHKVHTMRRIGRGMRKGFTWVKVDILIKWGRRGEHVDLGSRRVSSGYHCVWLCSLILVPFRIHLCCWCGVLSLDTQILGGFFRVFPSGFFWLRLFFCPITGFLCWLSFFCRFTWLLVAIGLSWIRISLSLLQVLRGGAGSSSICALIFFKIVIFSC